jgi:S-adenosylmethionine/arginine decarboxylase-like enzyme
MEGGMMVMFDAHLPSLLTFCTLRRFLNQAPGVIGMTRISEPEVVEGFYGFNGIVILAESHIALHEQRDGHIAIVHIFSCKSFDIDGALPGLLKLLGGADLVDYTLLAIPRPFPQVTFG